MFQETDPAPQRDPLVTVCRCCGQALNLQWFDPRHPKIAAKWQVECKTPDCALQGVTASDSCYTETTDQWVNPKE